LRRKVLEMLRNDHQWEARQQAMREDLAVKAREKSREAMHAVREALV
jgi:hypothetical protein